MASEIFELNTLDKLNKRLVRGARIGLKNATSSGSAVIASLESNLPFYEYLVEISQSGKTFESTKPIAVSQYIFIRNEYTYNPDGTRQYASEQFAFDKDRAVWTRLEGYSVNGPVNVSQDFSLLESGIDIRFLPSISNLKPDYINIGEVLNKVLVNSSENLTDLPLTPIPYPADHSSLVVKLTEPPNGEVTLVYGTDFAINYTQDPSFLFPPPPHSDRQVAFIKFLGDLDSDQFTVDQDFTGNFLISDGDDPVQGIYSRNEELRVGGDLQVRNVNYVINYDTGEVDFITPVDQETLVNYVLYESAIHDDGIRVIKGVGNPPVFNDENRLVRGTDYNLNEESGAINFLTPITSSDRILVEYFVEGEGVTGDRVEKKFLPANQNTLRTERFPILANSLTVTNALGSSSQRVLIENEDYSVSYKTGNVTFLKPLVNRNIVLDYIPLAKIACVLSPTASDPDQFTIAIRNDRIGVLEKEQHKFRILNPNVSVRQENALDPKVVTFTAGLSPSSVTKVSLKDPISGVESQYDIAQYIYRDSDKVLELRSDKQSNKPPVGPSSLVVADYSYVDNRLPYAPVVAGSLVLSSGANFFEVEDKNMVGNLQPGVVIRVVDRATESYFYFELDTVSFNGVDTFCTIKGVFPQDIVNPPVLISDVPIIYNPIPGGYLAAGAKAGTIEFAGDFTGSIRVGSLLKIKGTYVHTVLGVELSDGVTVVDISPFLFEQLLVTDAVSVSDSPVFLAGDTIIPTQRFIITEPLQPAFEVRIQDEENASGTISLLNDTLTIKMESEFGLSEHTFTVSDFETVKQLTDHLLVSLPGPEFSVTLFSDDPGISWKTADLVETEETLLPHPMTVRPEVILNGHRLPIAGVSFEVENGSVVLSRPLQRDDRVVGTYMGRDRLSNRIGSAVNVKLKYFRMVADGSKVVISTQYLNPDQLYVETLREDDYVRSVFFPEVEQIISQKSGQVGGGVEGSDDAEVRNSDGGLENNYFRLREQEIRIPLFTKIQNYYKDRLKVFGREVQNILGYRLGNTDVKLPESNIRYELVTETDINNALNTDLSKIFPEGYKQTSPLLNQRFSQEILFYAQAFFIGSVAQALNENGDPTYLGWSEVLSVGDQIRMRGREDYLTIANISPDGRTLTFTGFIPGLDPSGDLSDFYVSYPNKPGYPIWDDAVYIGAKAVAQEYIVGTNVLAFGTFRRFKIGAGQSLKVDVTLANGSVVPITRQTAVRRTNLDQVVDWLTDDSVVLFPAPLPENDLPKYFMITKERAYGVLGVRDAITFRGHLRDVGTDQEVVSFTFRDDPSATVAKNLGFEIGVPYTPYYAKDNLNDLLERERTAEVTQSGLLFAIKTVPNKMNRRSTTYKAPFVANANLLTGLLSSTKSLLLDTISQTDLIMVETDASDAIEVSHDEAEAAKAIYVEFRDKTDTEIAAHAVYASNVNFQYDRYILSFKQNILDKDTVNDALEFYLDDTGDPTFVFSSQGVDFSDDARIFYGDKTGSAAIPLDSGPGTFVFPHYTPSGEKLPGAWDTGPGAVSVLSITRVVPIPPLISTFNYQVTQIDVKLRRDSSTYTFPFASYPTIAQLVTGINTQTGGNFTAAVVGPNGAVQTGLLASMETGSPGPTETLQTAVLPYSPSATFNFNMNGAFTFESTGTAPIYQITSTSIILDPDGVSAVTLNFATYPTIGQLVTAINGVTDFSATATAPGAYVYGVLVRTVSAVGVSGTVSAYLGIKSDIVYYQISDRNLNLKAISNGSRINDLDAFIGYLPNRFEQIKGSLGAERLTENWSAWLNFRMNKENGCNFQKRYIQDQIIKNQQDLAQMQNLL